MTTNLIANNNCSNETEFLNEQKKQLKLQLWEQLDGNCHDFRSEHKYSNSITIIDLMPRFKRGRGARKLANDPTRELEFKNKYSRDGEGFLCTVSPALVDIKQADNSVKPMYCYPSDGEELIEKVIFLLASVKGIRSIHIGGNKRYAVSFSLYQIREHLISIGATKSYSQIRESLNIIRDSRTRSTKYNPNDKNHTIEVTQSIWADVAIEMKGSGRAKDKCYMIFSDYVAEHIFNVNYRQVLFSRFTSYSSSFSRYLDLYLSNVWTQASFNKTYPLSMNTVMEMFGKSGKSIVTKRRDMYLALDDLVKRNVIKNRTNAVKKDPKDIESGSEESDFIFYIEPTEVFIKEMIVSNAKRKGFRSLNQQVESGERLTMPNNFREVSVIT